MFSFIFSFFFFRFLLLVIVFHGAHTDFDAYLISRTEKYKFVFRLAKSHDDRVFFFAVQ